MVGVTVNTSKSFICAGSTEITSESRLDEYFVRKTNFLVVNQQNYFIDAEWTFKKASKIILVIIFEG